MSNKSYLQHAMVASCIIHCLLLAGAGWLGVKLFNHNSEPECIEMELVSSVAIPEAAPVPIAVPQTNPVTQTVTNETSRPNVTAQTPLATASSDDVATSVSQSVASVSSGGTSDAAVPVSASVGVGGTDAAPPVSHKISRPRILSKVKPSYPEDARQDGFEGTVGVKIEVQENGRPGEVQLVRSSGRSSMDEAAIRAVRKWRFVPAQEEGTGRAVRCYTTLSVVFELNS